MFHELILLINFRKYINNYIILISGVHCYTLYCNRQWFSQYSDDFEPTDSTFLDCISARYYLILTNQLKAYLFMHKSPQKNGHMTGFVVQGDNYYICAEITHKHFLIPDFFFHHQERLYFMKLHSEAGYLKKKIIKVWNTTRKLCIFCELSL